MGKFFIVSRGLGKNKKNLGFDMCFGQGEYYYVPCETYVKPEFEQSLKKLDKNALISAKGVTKVTLKDFVTKLDENGEPE